MRVLNKEMDIAGSEEIVEAGKWFVKAVGGTDAKWRKMI